MKNDVNMYKKMMNNMRMNDYEIYKKNGYFDPDSFPNKKDKKRKYDNVFYEKLCDALQNNLKNINDKNLRNIKFFCHHNPIEKEKMGIFIYKNNDLILQLKSDQFGFSARYMDHKKRLYPYSAYFYFLCQNKPNKISEGLSRIFGDGKKGEGWINRTRRPGGSFLWPIDNNDKSFNPEYNKKRGGACGCSTLNYIQDRVDLTLYEIKEIFERVIENTNLMPDDEKEKEVKKAIFQIRQKTKRIKRRLIEPGNVLAQRLRSKKGYKNMFIFLETFRTFETFIRVFGFDGNFVRKVENEWKIVNIFPYNCDDEDKTDRDDEYVYLNDKYVKKARYGEKLFTINTKAEDFENMFDVVCKLIEERRKKLSLK